MGVTRPGDLAPGRTFLRPDDVFLTQMPQIVVTQKRTKSSASSTSAPSHRLQVWISREGRVKRGPAVQSGGRNDPARRSADCP
jgi:hypothetical protein